VGMDRLVRVMVGRGGCGLGYGKSEMRETHLPPFFDGFHFGSVSLEFLFRHDVRGSRWECSRLSGSKCSG
jgi:hypothetical protein